MSPSWYALIFIAVFVVLLILVGWMLYSIAKRGDERSRFIKTKAMSAAFIGTVILLVMEAVRVPASQQSGSNPLLLLVLITFIFLVSLIVYKKKYGDLG